MNNRQIASMFCIDFSRDFVSGTTANVVLCDLDLNFEGQTFQVSIKS